MSLPDSPLRALGAEELAELYLEEKLAPAQEAALAEMLSRNPGALEEVSLLLQLDAALRRRLGPAEERADLSRAVASRIRAAGQSQRMASRVKRALGEGAAAGDPWRTGASSRRRSRRPGRSGRRAAGLPFLAAAAALLLAAAGAFVLLGGRKATAPWRAEISRLDGAAEVVRAGGTLAAASGAPLRPGDRLDTGADARLTVRYSNGTTVEMNEQTTFSLGASPFERLPRLERGDIYVVAAGPITVNRGEYDEVSVLGTEFELSRSSGRAVVRVAAGTVRFGREVSVGALLTSGADAGGAPGAPEAVEVAAIAPWRNDLDRGLAGWWKFDENAGEVAHDSSRNGNHGRLVEAGWTEGRFGNGLLLDGKGQVEVAWSDSLTATNGVSVAMWLRLVEGQEGLPGPDRPYLAIGQKSDKRNYRFSMFSTGGASSLFMSHSWEGQAAGPLDVHSMQACAEGVSWPKGWTHLAFTVSTDGGGSYAAYVNGEAIKPSTFGQYDPKRSRPFSHAERSPRFERLVLLTDEPLVIGGVSGFRGVVDDVRVYRRALSAEEIRRLAEGGGR